ncbi:MAG: zinc dependent phospholipase C family protein [Candidatus Poribacteria bacterium]|nr:zinc dependent phospholipase C family protein [Candidatus Poribacteria bacterium]
MAGPHIHIHVAKQVVLQTPEIIPNGQTSAFHMGNLIPDLGMWPGGPPLWSGFLHFVGNMTFCKRLYELSSSTASKALASGMLLHILVDLHAHPVINRIAATHYGDVLIDHDRKRGLTWEDNPAAHAAIESGFDLLILEETRSFDEFDTMSYPDEAITADCPLAQAFCECYAQELDVVAFRRAIRRFPKRLSTAMRCQAFFNTHPVGKMAGTMLAKGLPVILGSKGRLAAAVIQPHIPTEMERFTFRDALQSAIETWKGLVTGVEPWPTEDFNLDIGLPSRRGQHKTADQLMDDLSAQNTPDKVMKRFGDGGENILHRWEQIRTRFEGESEARDNHCVIRNQPNLSIRW